MSRRGTARGRRFTIGVAASAMALGVGGTAVGAATTTEVSDVRCLTSCSGPRAAGEGSAVRIEGTRLRGSESVEFAAAGTGRVEAPARRVRPRSLRVVVPSGAETGRPRVVDSEGEVVRSPVRLRVIAEGEPESPTDEEPSSSGFAVMSVKAAPRKSFFGSGRAARLTYRFQASEPTDVRIDVLRHGSGKRVASWVERGARPGVENEATWNGKSSGGKVLDRGRFRFTVAAADSDAAAKRGDSAGFQVLPAKFPVRGSHGYGDGFGAGRGHQGADVFADCGTRLVAARAGRVQYRGYHSAAGNYVVIDSKRSGRDYAYMHLRRTARVSDGERVRTGEGIGRVGETGNASGCHLHFEIWSSPGWYEGGSAQSSVMRELKKWDGWS